MVKGRSPIRVSRRWSGARQSGAAGRKWDADPRLAPNKVRAKAQILEHISGAGLHANTEQPTGALILPRRQPLPSREKLMRNRRTRRPSGRHRGHRAQGSRCRRHSRPAKSELSGIEPSAEALSRLHLAGGDVDDVAVRIGEPDRLHIAHRGHAVVPFQAFCFERHE
jgi:hypothetical protein